MSTDTTATSTAVAHAAAMHAPSLDRCPLMPTYGPPKVMFVRGAGAELWDADGKRYLDFLAGLAVTSLGHANPEVAEAIADQARTLCHVSNLFGTTPGWEVAVALDGLLGGGGQVFFANSGAEANEAAFKLARKWGGGSHGRYAVVSAYNSFHGRTFAALHATGQPAKHEPFQPLPDGFRHVEFNNLDALSNALKPDVAAVHLEAVQGEGGVNVADMEYLKAVRELCNERGVLLMIDEVQTGLGRTGKWFAFQHYGIVPDVVCLAKALGNGMPIGAIWARAEVAAAFQPGDHATTYGGQPLATSAARKVLEIMQREDVPARAEAMGARLREGLLALPGVTSVRGLGLLLAAELATAGGPEVAASCLEAGLVVNGISPTAVRFAPSLLVTEGEVDEAVEMFGKVLAS